MTQTMKPFPLLSLLAILSVFQTKLNPVTSLNIVIPGGTGPMGRLLSSTLHNNNAQQQRHAITILCRNAFLASAPARVSSDFGWLGQSFLEQHPRIRLRDWDGGDLLDIVGCDWMGWQEDALQSADVVINLVGGFTEQRTMACERIVRESLRVNPSALQIMVSPLEEDLRMRLKRERVRSCEEMVLANCKRCECLRVEMNDLMGGCRQIMDVIETL